MFRRTHQRWLIYLAHGGMLVGTFVLGLGLRFHVMPLALAGLAVPLLVEAVVAFAVRCPHCGYKWYWHAVAKIPVARWELWLETVDTCPGCEATFRDPPPRHRHRRPRKARKMKSAIG